MVSTLTLTGGEVLAKDVINASGIVLIPAGTIIKKEYINKLSEIGQNVIFIESEALAGEPDYAEEQIIIGECTDKVKNTFEKYFSSTNSELNNVCEVAQEIIGEMLKKPEVMININSLRQDDEKKYSHSVNVCAMSVLFGIKMGLSKNIVDDIAVGSILHDIGYEYCNSKLKSNISAQVSPDVDKELKKHVIYGYSAVQNEKWINDIGKDIILSHHERMDGSGYPFHLSGKKIKIGARIVAVCDEFDNLIFKYNKKVHEAIDYILSESDNKLDYEVVNVFNESVAAYPIGTIVITNEGEKGIVVRQNNKCPTRPVINILINDTNGNKFIEKDLTSELTLFIVDTIDKI